MPELGFPRLVIAVALGAWLGLGVDRLMGGKPSETQAKSRRR